MDATPEMLQAVKVAVFAAACESVDNDSLARSLESNVKYAKDVNRPGLIVVDLCNTVLPHSLTAGFVDWWARVGEILEYMGFYIYAEMEDHYAAFYEI